MRDILEVLRFLFTEYFFQKRRKKVLHSKWRSRPHSRHNKFRGPQYPKIGNIEERKLPPPVVDPVISNPTPVWVDTLHRVKKEIKSTRVSTPYPTKNYGTHHYKDGLLNVEEAAQYFPKSLTMYHPTLGEVIFKVMYAIPFSNHSHDSVKIRLKSNNPDIQHECEISNGILGYTNRKEVWVQKIYELLTRRMRNLLNVTYGAY